MRYPENYLPITCPVCGGPLIRPGDKRWTVYGAAVVFMDDEA